MKTRGAAFLVVGLAALAQTPTRDYATEKELALGKSLAAEIERSNKMSMDSAAVGHANRVAQRLASHAGLAMPLKVGVIETEEARAIPLPGGYLFVSTGLLRRVRTEADLAAIMAHEIAHIATRHGIRTAGGNQPLVFMGGGSGVCTRLGSASIPPGYRNAARGFEDEADRLGAAYLAKSGYDPAIMAGVFNRLLPAPPRIVPSLRKLR
jgi:predicted Zn-dependent protease